MKKPESRVEEMRAEYRREDLGPLVRGKYSARHSESSNVVVIDPSLTEAFPNGTAVNQALRGLLDLAQASARKKPPVRKSKKVMR
jgi:hypothetical protein